MVLIAIIVWFSFFAESVKKHSHLQKFSENSSIVLDRTPFGLHWAGAANERLLNNLHWVMEQISDLGAQWLRVNILWSSVEKQTGQYDWSLPDSIIHHASKRNVNLLVQFRGYTKTSLYTASEVEKLGAYTNYLVHFVNRYKNKVHYWQIENEIDNRNFWDESPEKYVDILKSSYQSIKLVDSSATILLAGWPSGALQYPKVRRYVDYVFINGKDFFDIVDLHLYRLYSDVSVDIADFRRLMELYNCQKPIWVTEIGGPDMQYYDEPPTEIIHSNEVVKRYVLALSMGVQKVFWHGLAAFESGESRFGIMALIKKGRHTSAYYTYRTMVQKLGTSLTVEHIYIDDDIRCYCFGKDTGNVYVVWGTLSKQIDFPISAKTITITDVFGHASTILSNNFTITESPLFIEYSH